MKRMMNRTVLGGLLAAGLMLAQTPPPAAGTTPRASRGRGMLAHAVRLLNLTPDQQAQAKTIFQAGQTDAKPVTAQMQSARQALANAVKSNAPDAQIDQLSAAVGPLASQLAAIRTKTFAKFYAILTPEQKDKLNVVIDLRLSGGLGPAGFAWRGPAARRQVPQQ
jgi:Spy/CpxP family protein refolding chaperone